MDTGLLSRLLDEEGRLTRYPSKFKTRVYATLHIAVKFEQGRVYSEKQVNELIRSAIAFDDYVLVRRDLVDMRCLFRKADGSEYRRADVLPAAEDIIN